MLSSEVLLEALRTLQRGDAVQLPSGPWGLLLEVAFNHPHQDARADLIKNETPPVLALAYSGGLDSMVMLERAEARSERVYPFYLGYDSGYQAAEWRAIEAHLVLPTLLSADLTHNKGRYGYMVPGRNLLFVLKIHEYLSELKNPGEIWLGKVAGESMPLSGDKSELFRLLLNTALGHDVVPHTLEYPLMNETKAQLVAWWLETGRDGKRLLTSYSCQAEQTEPVHCGRCQACFSRWVALRNNGLEGAQEWRSDPLHSAQAKAAASKISEAGAIIGLGYASPYQESSVRSAEDTLNALQGTGLV